MIRLTALLFIATIPAHSRMNPADSMGLIRLEELQTSLDSPGTDWRRAVELAHVLHDMRRDKPALRVMMTVPSESLNVSHRLFLASLYIFDSDLPSAFATAAPVCIVPSAVILAILVLVTLRIARGRKGDD